MATTNQSAVFYGTRVAWSETRTSESVPEASPAIVLLHGSPGTRNDWEEVTSRMRGAWRVLAIDRPGYGSSGPAQPGAITIGGNTRVIGALLESQAPGGSIVVGYSHSGGVAISLAAMRPSLVRGLVLVASIGSPKAILPSDYVTSAPLLGGAFSYFLLRLLASLAPSVIARLASASQPAPSIDAVTAMIRRSVAAQRVWKTYVRESRSMIESTADLEMSLALIDAPTLVVGADQDSMVPLAASRDLAARVAHARLVTVEGTGHSIPIERPGILASHIESLARGVRDSCATSTDHTEG